MCQLIQSTPKVKGTAQITRPTRWHRHSLWIPLFSSTWPASFWRMAAGRGMHGADRLETEFELNCQWDNVRDEKAMVRCVQESPLQESWDKRWTGTWSVSPMSWGMFKWSSHVAVYLQGLSSIFYWWHKPRFREMKGADQRQKRWLSS